MKKILMTISVFAIAIAAFGQDYENAIKLRPSWLLTQPIKQLAFQYERGLTDNLSAYANLGYIIPRNFIKDGEIPKQVRDIFGLGDTELGVVNIDGRDVTMEKLQFSGWHAGLGGRFYPQAEAIKRFYIGAKATYTNTGFNNAAGVDQDMFDYSADLKVNSINLALEIGNQFIIADVVSIDWTILSFGTSMVKTKANYSTTDPNRDYVEDKAEIDNWFSTTLNLPTGSTGESIHTVTTRADGNDIDVQTILMPYFRAGITIGYVF